MKRYFSFVCALSLILVVAQRSDASIFASSYLEIADFKILNSPSLVPITADFQTSGAGQIRITASSDSSSADATLNGTTVMTSAPSLLPPNPNGLDTPVAVVGAVIGDNVFSPRPNGPAPPSYARGDSDGSGTIVNILSPAIVASPAGATVQTIADVVIANGPPGGVDLGNSGTTVSGGTSFTFQVLSQIKFVLDFTATLDLVLDYSTLPPTGLNLIGSSTFQVAVFGTERVNNITSPISFDYTPAALNVSLVNSTPGSVAGSNVTAVHFQSQEFTLNTGTYTFNITQGNTAAINDLPEPASMAAWAILAICGGSVAVQRRRRVG